MRREVRLKLQQVTAAEGARYVKHILNEALEGRREHREAMECLRYLGKYAVGAIPDPQPVQKQEQQQSVNQVFEISL